MAGAPEACTLPAADPAATVAEFDESFATSLIGQERTASQRLHWRFQLAAEAAVRDPTAREDACGSFFTVIGTTDRGRVQVDIEVPPTQIQVLDGLRRWAAGRRCDP